MTNFLCLFVSCESQAVSPEEQRLWWKSLQCLLHVSLFKLRTQITRNCYQDADKEASCNHTFAIESEKVKERTFTTKPVNQTN